MLCPQVPDRTPGFNQTVTHHALRKPKMLLGSIGRIWQRLLDRLKLQRDSNEALSQRVVNLAGHSIALVQNRGELTFYSPDAKPVHRKPDQGQAAAHKA